MNKRYIIDRVKSDLRNDIYELMTHYGYHTLEKELTESLLNNNEVYCALRHYMNRGDIPLPERVERKTVYSYLIFKKMNEQLGGFHFDRFKSFTIGDSQNDLLNEMMSKYDFADFLRNYASFESMKNEEPYHDFAKSNQHKNLEDTIAMAIKKNNVIPAVTNAIAQDIVDALELTENYFYMQLGEASREQVFDYSEESISDYISLKKLKVLADNSQCTVMLKRSQPGSPYFTFLLTNFGSCIRGK
ncbi:MAG: hypothetical protein GF401_09655 [Chitinivibrionales bacterium]|nr:hypothetical protein [Chitinivibrionales bacterium]